MTIQPILWHPPR